MPKTADLWITGSRPSGCGVGDGVRSSGVDGSEAGGGDNRSEDMVECLEKFGDVDQRNFSSSICEP